ncbi:A disintegrin and metalloproteinase with thrombospondin motifs gon-1 isoform X2 [Diachasma alloeum]|uniref:A disintegrin and metalloproteinase with thrombospondin motifs gon-1 isoform X2 n=1 Tax=Diachasma alloeum TaxID=454923 RepID=UPI00073847A1|nr:A disintegrin and metalloproteinase with thrombospondin motifs gon-1 isoform X2 [Diachasma alloeum]
MIPFELFLIASFFCVLPNASGYVHYGINLDPDDSNLFSHGDYDREEQVQVLHSFRHPSPGSVSSSRSRAKSEHDDSYLSLKLHAFGEDIAVDLKRVRDALANASTPVWLARGSDKGNVTFTRAAKNTLGKAVELYQDRPTESSVIVIGYGDSNLYFVGVISGLRIRYQPMTGKTTRRIRRRSTIDGYTGSNVHIVSKISRRKREAQIAAASTINSQIKLNATSSNTSTIYPELFVATDYNIPFESTSSEDFYNHLIYILAFFNGVDLIFQQLSDPDIRLHIAGIVVGANPSAAPYLHNNKNASGVINATAALAEMGKFYGNLSDKDFSAGSYDIIVTLTNSYICDESEEEICTPILAGVSSLEPLCKNKRPVVDVAAILQDNLAFSGLRMTAHELGHILGAEHDGEKEEETQDCHAAAGYLMSKYDESSTVSLKWSNCSLEAFRESLKSSSAECLRNPPNWGKDEEPLRSILPSDVVGLHYQCQAFGYRRACMGPQNCKALTCTTDIFPFSLNCVTVSVPAAQGSTCGCGSHCINEECVKK